MKVKSLCAAAVIAWMLFSVSANQPATAQLAVSNIIFIRQNGSIEPSSAPIQQTGVYTFTDNIHRPIVVERGDIILDGNGHYLEPKGNSSDTELSGYDVGVGVNLTASHVTVQNIHMLNWDAGVFGAYNEDIISGNFISDCSCGVKIYAKNYTVTGNYIANNVEGVRLRENQAVVSRNSFINNRVGLQVSNFNHFLVTENNMSNVSCDIMGSWCGDFVVYRNNFLKTNVWGYICPISNCPVIWNVGCEGNYWSGYNGTDRNGDGIGDEPYTIPNAHITDMQDTYPFVEPINIEESPRLSPELSPSPTPTSPSPTPTPTPTMEPICPAPAATTSPSPSQQSATTAPEQADLPSYAAELIFLVAVAALIAFLAVALATKRRKISAEG